MYGGSSEASSFEHTVRIVGTWIAKYAYPRGDEPYPPPGWTPDGTTTNPPLVSFVYYLPTMGNAQQALAYVLGGTAPIRPVYGPPPLDSAREAQFDGLTKSIGTGLGNSAAHETGHQLAVRHMECGDANTLPCPEDYIYENSGVGSAHEWSYGDIPNEKIHWSPDATCDIEKYLIGTGYAIHDPACH